MYNCSAAADPAVTRPDVESSRQPGLLHFHKDVREPPALLLPSSDIQGHEEWRETGALGGGLQPPAWHLFGSTRYTQPSGPLRVRRLGDGKTDKGKKRTQENLKWSVFRHFRATLGLTTELKDTGPQQWGQDHSGSPPPVCSACFTFPSFFQESLQKRHSNTFPAEKSKLIWIINELQSVFHHTRSPTTEQNRLSVRTQCQPRWNSLLHRTKDMPFLLLCLCYSDSAAPLLPLQSYTLFT